MLAFDASITKAELAEFNEFARKRIYSQPAIRSRAMLLNVIYWIPLGLAVAALLNFYSSCQGCRMGHLNAAVVFVFLWFVGAMIYQRWLYRTAIANSATDPGPSLGKFRFELGEEGILAQCECFSSTSPWSSIKAIHAKDGCLYLFTDIAKAVILPLGSLADSQQEAVREVIRKRSGYEL